MTLSDGEHAKRTEHKGHMGLEASKSREDGEKGDSMKSEISKRSAVIEGE